MADKNSTSVLHECPLCGGKMTRQAVEAEAVWGKFSVRIKGIDADVCETCHEEYYDIEDAKLLENMAKALSESSGQQIINDSENAILNLQETAQLLRVSTQSIYNMIKSGRIKAKKVGREWRFFKAEILAMISSNKTLPAAARNGKSISDNDKDVLKRLSKEE